MGADGRTEAALDGLATRYGLRPRQREQLARLVTVLVADEHAPTAVRTAGPAVDIHFADSLVALELEVARAARRVADVGTGAGFPGLVLALALPDAEVRLVESQRRKCEFLERLCACVAIENARVVHARAEEWRAGIGEHDLVVARAVAAQAVVLEYAAPLLRLGGTLVDWRGQRDPREETRCVAAGEELGLRRAEIRHVSPFASAQAHHLHLYLKVRETPSRFPRRVGMARKQPLSG